MPFENMPSKRLLSRKFPLTVAILVGFLINTAHAADTVTLAAFPMLLGKSWAIGYALVFLCVLLGLLAVLIPSMRKTLRRKD